MRFFVSLAKFTKRLLFVLFVLVVLVIWLTNTHTGNSLIISVLEKIEPRLNISLTEGSLFYSPIYENIRWQDGDTLIELNNVSYQFDWGCIVEEFCLDSLTVNNANIHIPQSEEPAAEEESEPFILEFPLPVHIRHLDINNTHIKVAGIDIDLKKLLLTADGEGNDLTLNTSISGLMVVLADVEAQPTTVQKKSPKLNNPITSFPAILTDQTLPEVVLPFNLIANKLNVNDFKLIQNKENISVINDLKSKFTFIGSEVKIDNFKLDIPEANVDIKGNIDLSKRYPMDMEVVVNVKEVKELEPSTLLKGQKIKLMSKGDLADLHSEITLSHLINAKINNKIDLYSENLPHQLTIQWDKFTWPLTGAEQVTTSKGNVSSRGDLNNYTLDVQTHYALPDLPAGDISLQGQGDLQSMALKQLLINTLQGKILLTGKLNWVKNMTWLGDLNINNIDFKEFSDTYPATLNGHIKQSVTVPLNDNNKPAWAFNFPIINLKGSFLNKPLTVNGAVNGDEKAGFNVNNLNIINGDNNVEVNGKVADKNDLVLDLNIQDLSKIVVETTGKIIGKVTLAGSLEKMQVNTSLEASNISYLENSVERLSLSGKATIADIPFADLNVDAKNIVANKQKIESLSVSINPEYVSAKKVEHNLNIALKSDVASSDLDILFTQELKSWQAKLNKGLIKTTQGLLVLEKPFTVTMEKETINLTEHCWSATNDNNAKNGQLCIKKFSAGDNGNININVNDFLIATLSPFVPKTLSLEGALDADIKMAWTKNKKPSIDLTVDGKDIALNIMADGNTQKPINYPVEAFHIEMQTDQEKADFTLKAVSDGLLNANLKGQIKPYKATPEIEANLDLSLPNFDAFSSLIPQVDKLAGYLKADMNISGQLDKPSVKGQVVIADVSMKAPNLPIQVSDLNTEISIDNNTATVNGFFFTNSKKETKKKRKSFIDKLVSLKNTAISTVSIPQRIANLANENKELVETDGRVDITGLIDWVDELKATIHLEADQMRIEDYGKIELYLSPNIDLIYDKHISIEGVINVDKGNITVKELPAGAVNVSKDVIVVDAEKQTDSADLPMKMNVKVSLGDKLRIKAMGLDSYINGDLLVRKELTKELTVNGELSFSEGSYRALSQELVLQNSRIIFQGQADAPYLNIEAIRDPTDIEDNVTAGVRVTGTPDQIQLTIFSDPAMSQQNALSYITRGYSIENDTGDGNSSQLAAILIDLGAGQTDGVMNDIGDKVGIKDLSLASSGQGSEQSVGIKGTIAPGVEISYGVGVFDSFTIFAIRYELFKQFYIEASSGLYQAVDAYYEWDWD